MPDPAEVARIAAYFAPPSYETLPATSGEAFEAARAGNPDFARWVETNLTPHRQPGYAALTISLKPIGAPPGDATSEQMEVVADIADEYSLSTRSASATSRTSSCRM
jgi:sulfite reductase (NADPH) hemoprotein beta-component